MRSRVCEAGAGDPDLWVHMEFAVPIGWERKCLEVTGELDTLVGQGGGPIVNPRKASLGRSWRSGEVCLRDHKPLVSLASPQLLGKGAFTGFT